MANFDIHIDSLPINYTSKVTFKNVENCDALNNDIPIVLVSNIIEVHSLLSAYLSPTNVKSLVITHIIQGDPNQYLKYGDDPITTDILPLIIPIDDLGTIDTLTLVEKYVPSNNVTSLRVDFYIIDENDTIGPAVTSYIQAKKVECTGEPVTRDPIMLNVVKSNPDYQKCQTVTFDIDRNGSVNPVKYKLGVFEYPVNGYAASLRDYATAESYEGDSEGEGSYYTGTLNSTDVNTIHNMEYSVCTHPIDKGSSLCHILFQIYKEDGVTVNVDYGFDILVDIR